MEWIMIKVRVGQETFCKWVQQPLFHFRQAGGGEGAVFLGAVLSL